jgi:hypothetical protein
MSCRECGDEFELWGSVLLCDRCLCARLWKELEGDDYVMIRRIPSGDLFLNSNRNGSKRGTNLTLMHLDVEKELLERFEEVFGG